MRLLVERGRYPAAAARHFDFARLDAFHGPEMLTALWGEDWYGVLVEDGPHAWLHGFGTRPIRDTGYFDIEPQLGYAGPVATNEEPGFLAGAWAAYVELCRGARIVAELFRFHPILGNHHAAPAALVRVFASKKIVQVRCHVDAKAQLAEFSASCAQSVRTGGRRLQFVTLAHAGAMDEFRHFHHRSLDRVGAAAHWYMSPQFFARVAGSPSCAVFAVVRGEEIVSAALGVIHPLASYYLLAGNAAERPAGASELLIHGLARESAARGSTSLILGGGNTAAADDSLLAFKRKFARACDVFHVGGAVYLPAAFEDLCDAAVASEPALALRPHFLKYRALAA